MNPFEDDLQLRLADIRSQNLFRQLRWLDSSHGAHIQIGGDSFVNFSSNDYLGLINHPALKEAAIAAIAKYGPGAGASRLAGGSLALFHELEEALATFKDTAAALTFSSGYATAAGTISALLTKDDIIIIDKLVHACIVDAAKLSEAKIRVFNHNDLDALEARLKWASKAARREAGQRKSRILIVTESVFSMDGDVAPLAEIVALKEKYGAWLMLDEAHATGVIGKRGRGLASLLGVSEHIEIHMGTMGKALGSAGGFICGSRALIDFLVNSARSFIFSTAPVPAAAAAAQEALKIIQTGDGQHRRTTLIERIFELEQLLPKVGNQNGSAILPIIIGDEAKTVGLSEKLYRKKLLVPAIRYPTVARGTARLRVTLTATHSLEDVQLLASNLESFQ